MKGKKMQIEILGKQYPLAYTVEAQGIIDKKIGGLKNFEKLFNGENTQDILENTLFLLHTLMQSAQNRERVKNKMLGIDATFQEIPSIQDLSCVFEVKDVKDLIQQIAMTIQLGSKITIELDEEKGKKKEK